MQILEVRHLLLVAAVADEGSLTSAGRRLNLTQSALSHQLLDVEERLGTPLFHRFNRKMTLTEAGERVLASARRILDDLKRTEEDLRLYSTNQRGAIRVTTECYTVYHWLPSVMKTFHASYPGIDIRIDVDSTEGEGATFRVLLPIHQYADADRLRQSAPDDLLIMETML